MIKFLDLPKQYLSIKNEIDQAISAVIMDAAFIGGKYVENFEKEFASHIGSKFCLGVGNGTDALEIMIEACDFPEGSEIIVPGNSFVSTAECVVRNGLVPVFADVNPLTHTLDHASVESKVSKKTVALIAVHLYGHPCDMDRLLELSDKYNFKVFEDCAQSHDATYKGKKVGTFGIASEFSFYPGKNLGAYGDGGAILTDDYDLYKKMRMIANHGRVNKFDHRLVGRNSRLDGLQAAILSVKLRHLEEWSKKRKICAHYYLDNLKDIPQIQLPFAEKWADPVYHLFVIRTSKRDQLREYLKQNEIETGLHYPKSIPKLTAFENYRLIDENMIFNQIDSELLSLPIGEHLDENDLGKVVKSIREYFIIEG